MSTVLGCCSSPNFNRECFNTLIFASIAHSRNTLLQAAKRLRCTYSGCPIQDQERRWISDTFIHVCTTQNNWVSFFVSIHTARLSTSTWMPRTAPEACGRRRLPIIDQVMLRVDFRAVHGRNFRRLLFRHPGEFVLTFDSYSPVLILRIDGS